jgi:hypothetical protein
MAENRKVDIERVTSAMDSTQLSIRDTLAELRDRVRESADWRHQVSRRPLVSLSVAVACGVVLARLLIPPAARARRALSLPPGRRGATHALAAASGVVGLLTQLAAFAPLLRQARRVLGRLGGRLAGSRPRA